MEATKVDIALEHTLILQYLSISTVYKGATSDRAGQLRLERKKCLPRIVMMWIFPEPF